MVPSHRLRLRLVAPSAGCWPLERYSRAISSQQHIPALQPHRACQCSGPDGLTAENVGHMQAVLLDEPQTVYVGLVLLGLLCVAVLFVAARYYRLKASIAWNAIADGADSASTGAPVQGRQLGFNDVEASTPSTGAHADSLAYECECRSLRRSKRKQRSSECKRKEILTHTHLLTSYTKLTYIWFFCGVSWATRPSAGRA